MSNLCLGRVGIHNTPRKNQVYLRRNMRLCFFTSPGDGIKRELNAFTYGNPFFRGKLLGISVGRSVGFLEGLRSPRLFHVCVVCECNSVSETTTWR